MISKIKKIESMYNYNSCNCTKQWFEWITKRWSYGAMVCS